MQRRQRDCLLFVSLLCLIITIAESATVRGGGGRRRSPVTIPVGVILDLSSSLGSMALDCANIALQDFYSTHNSYSTKLQLRFSDSGNDLPTADSAAWDLINNEKVHAIVGPQNSEQARFVVELGTNFHVPVIWFSPSGPSLLPPRSPFSVNSNCAKSRCFQFKAIAAIIEAYGWQCVIPIYEDPEFGNDLIPCLTFALQEMDTPVPHSSPIRRDFSDDYIHKELDKIKDKRKCVFLAHMTVELWSRLGKQAQDEGMMSEGYAWILTQGLSSVIDTKVKGFMEGALVVRPSLDVSSRNKRHSLAETLRGEYGKTLSIYGLWAYDTITSLALAVENTSLVNSNESTIDLRNETGPELRKAIQDANFRGLSGNFSLRKGQVEPSKVEVYNVKDQIENMIAYWSPETGHKPFQNHGEVDELTLPGNTKERPVKLRVGIPKTHFTQFVHVDGKGHCTGFAVEVFKKVVHALPFKLSYDFVPVNISGELTPSTYDDLLCNMTISKNVDVDVIIGDITTSVNRTKCVDFTLPYLDSSVSMVVKLGSDSKSVWILFEPFHWYLWSILGGIFVAATVFVIILEEKTKNDAEKTKKDAEKTKTDAEKTKNDTKSDFVRNPFLIYMTVLFVYGIMAKRGTDIELLENGTSKWVVIVVTFLLGLVVQVYTAKLTSILTERTMAKPSPWKDLQDIKSSKTVKVGYQTDSWVEGLLMHQLGFNMSRSKAYGSLEEYDDALSKGDHKGGVVAIFDETPYLMLLLSKCASCKITGPIYKAGGFAFAFRKNSTLVSSFSAAVLNVTQDAVTFLDMKSKSLPITIDKSEYSSDVETRRLAKGDFGGLFQLALFVLVLFSSLTILKVPYIASRLNSSLSNGALWLHNKLISYFGVPPA